MEQTRPQHREDTALGGNGDPAADADGDSAMVTISSWPYSERLPVGDMTVSEIRQRFAERFDIDPQSVATLDGQETRADTIVRAGQMLMFVRRAGEKGAREKGAGENGNAEKE